MKYFWLFKPHVSDGVKTHEPSVAKVFDVICFQVVVEFKKIAIYEIPFVMDKNNQSTVSFEDFSMNSCEAEKRVIKLC